jgi:hypothetical protein
LPYVAVTQLAPMLPVPPAFGHLIVVWTWLRNLHRGIALSAHLASADAVFGQLCTFTSY